MDTLADVTWLEAREQSEAIVACTQKEREQWESNALREEWKRRRENERKWVEIVDSDSEATLHLIGKLVSRSLLCVMCPHPIVSDEIKWLIYGERERGRLGERERSKFAWCICFVIEIVCVTVNGIIRRREGNWRGIHLIFTESERDTIQRSLDQLECPFDASCTFDNKSIVYDCWWYVYLSLFLNAFTDRHRVGDTEVTGLLHRTVANESWTSVLFNLQYDVSIRHSNHHSNSGK